MTITAKSTLTDCTAWPTDETTSWITCMILTVGLVNMSTIWEVRLPTAWPISVVGLEGDVALVFGAAEELVAGEAPVAGVDVELVSGVACLFYTRIV